MGSWKVLGAVKEQEERKSGQWGECGEGVKGQSGEDGQGPDHMGLGWPWILVFV